MLSLSAIKSTTALGSNFRVAQLLMKTNLRTSYTIGLGTNRILCRPMYKTVTEPALYMSNIGHMHVIACELKE